MSKINITEHIGPGEVNAFPGGVVKITRHGTADEDTSPTKNMVLAPQMSDRASLFISTDIGSLHDREIRVSSESLRWLSRFFESAANHMDRGLTVPEERPVYEPVLLVEDDNGDWFYTGDLTPAKRLVKHEREPVVKVHTDNRWTVDLIEKGSVDDVAEYGRGRTKNEAWRYALGAYFGPADDEYDEHRLLRALACGDWSSEPPVLPPAVEIIATPRLTVGENGEPIVSVENLSDVIDGDPWAIERGTPVHNPGLTDTHGRPTTLDAVHTGEMVPDEQEEMFTVEADTSNHNLPIGTVVHRVAGPEWSDHDNWFTQDNPESAVSISEGDLRPLR